MTCDGCIYENRNTVADVLMCTDCRRAYPEGSIEYELSIDYYEAIPSYFETDK
ncbi:MAG: hypothetical protein RR744_09890 [Cellulosilyticaceae bacterium]